MPVKDEKLLRESESDEQRLNKFGFSNEFGLPLGGSLRGDEGADDDESPVQCIGYNE